MTFLVITEAQQLIREAGGEFRAGDKLKNYWYTVCENLSIYADTWVQPRTIENLWRTGTAGVELIDALRKAAEGRKKKEQLKVSPHDASFIQDLQATFEQLKQDPLFPREETAILGGVISLLVAVAKRRQENEKRFSSEADRVALLKNCCQVSRALLREEAGEAAE